jgi:phenylacetate-CoA ligase
MLNWWGVDVSDNSGYLYRAVPVGFGRAVAGVLSYPTKRAYISASLMTAAEIKAFVQRLDRIQPAYLVGYVGAIDALAAFLRSEDKSVPYLKAVWTTAAPIPLGMRKNLDTVFGCPVYSQYGSVETYTMAADCPVRQGLHVFSDIRHVEMVRTNTVSGEKERGEVIVTDLTNYAFPLLRYRTGDTSRLIDTPCPCGRVFPMIEYVQGRVSDTIYLSDGTPVPGEFWTTIFDDHADSIRSFRVHQNTDRTIDITYEGVGPASASAAAAVLRTLSGKLGSSARIRVSQGTGALNDHGKLRFVTSDVTCPHEWNQFLSPR